MNGKIRVTIATGFNEETLEKRMLLQDGLKLPGQKRDAEKV